MGIGMRERRSTFAISLAGCDFGASGVGVFAQAVVPRLIGELRRRNHGASVVGTARERTGIGASDPGGVSLPRHLDRPDASAAFALAGLPLLATYLRVRALYLPAANRRIVAWAPVPTVGTVHDLAQFHVENKYGLARDLYIRRILAPTLRRLALILAPSQATADDLVRHGGVPRSRIRVVWNGISLVDPPPDRKPWRRPYLLYPARLEHPGKNHLRVIEAFAKSEARHTHDLLLSGKDWGAQGLIEQTVTRLGLDGPVVLLGYLSREALSGFLADADAVVAAGLFEGFGLQAAEALALGRPLAYSSTGSLPEVAGELGAAFDPLDVSAIARALDTVVFDERTRDQCAERGPARAKRFSWEACAAAIADALEEVASEAP